MTILYALLVLLVTMLANTITSLCDLTVMLFTLQEQVKLESGYEYNLNGQKIITTLHARR